MTLYFINKTMDGKMMRMIKRCKSTYWDILIYLLIHVIIIYIKIFSSCWKIPTNDLTCGLDVHKEWENFFFLMIKIGISNKRKGIKYNRKH